MLKPCKTSVHSFYPILLAALLLALFINFLPPTSSKLSNVDFDASLHSYQIGDLADSLMLLKKAFEIKDAYYIFNSSHLTTFSIPTHPAYFFYNANPTFLIGGGGHQNLLNILNLASLNTDLSNKKIVIILSSQWFSDQSGITKEYFNRWFHEIQLFELLNNQSLSTDLKTKIISRLMEMDNIKTNPVLYPYLVAKKYNLTSLEALLLPFIELQKNIAIKKENSRLNNIVSDRTPLNIPDNAGEFAPDKNFNSMYNAAATIARAETSNNIYGISNGYYKTYIDKKKKRKAFKANGFFTSKEYNDLKLFCDFLKEFKVEPMFVILPMHGKWLDEQGFGENNRKEFYDFLKSNIAIYNFEIADFSKYEYEEFFLSDIMHIGWIGWLRVNQKIEEFYAKK